jgi:hypothetical protein
MPDLHPLADISTFDETIREKLAPYWITTAEEFVTTAQTGNQQFGSGLAALVQVLGSGEEAVLEMVRAARAVLPPDTSFDVGPAAELGTGAIFEDMHLPEASAFDVPLQLPTEVSLTAELPPPQQQGKRETCLAFTLAAMYQHTSGEKTDLSEQFLYWACKERDGIPTVRGTKPDIALEVLRDMGVCSEPLWPYQSTPQPDNEGQGPPPEGAIQAAKQRRITGFKNLPARDIRQMKAALAESKTILIGLPIYEHWTDAWQARTLGRVRQPLPGEVTRGGHAMTAVGYRDDPAAPGGGYFIVRNSWGTTWGTENTDGAGYAHVPYRQIHETNIVACTIQGVISPDADSQPTDATQDTKGAAPLTETKQPTSTQLSATSTRPIDAEVQELYAEARTIRDQLNTLVERLAALTQRTRQGE